ncbi:hypothetical protein MTP99_012922 [Tenebrio molitor]|nr:hypothetical protein MTP99_012922 [Tenebrio molitor]
MSMHVCVSGLTSYQRAVLKSGKEDEEDDWWKSSSSLNSLDEVHKLYCGGKSLSKKTRDLFVEVTLAGMLELSTAYLPVNSNWNRYIANSEQAYEDLDIEGRILLARRADQACELLHDEKYKEDLWLWDQDWTVKNLKIKKKANQTYNS